ncbi:MAG: hypothetical protein F6K65_17080 [Moorea sp. SIO3C2]|nr:hypothetical protein [Moorena sp. SIO3C2]
MKIVTREPVCLDRQVDFGIEQGKRLRKRLTKVYFLEKSPDSILIYIET